jgi:amidase
LTDIAFDSAVHLADRIRRRDISSRELVEHCIARIERLDPKINAIVVRDFDRALAQAQAADEALAAGESGGPLHGVPITVKEAFDVASFPTTWGDPQLATHIATRDDPAVARLRAAGAIVLGKTNVSTRLQDLQTFNDIYGRTNNPWDLARSPGGSSGGSAASIAAGFAAPELGTDLGGSVRNPAHACGVYAHKPTYNLIRTCATTPPQFVSSADLVTAGPLARNPSDLALALDLMSGADEFRVGAWQLTLPRRSKPLRDYRVAFWLEDAHAPVTQEIVSRGQQLAQLLANLGAQVSEHARPEYDAGRMDEIFRGLLDALVNPRSRLTHRQWLALEEERTRLRYIWREFFQLWDVLVCPIAPTAAIEHDRTPMRERTLRIDGIDVPFFQQLFWPGLATASYLPATAFPVGPNADGLPLGLQAIGAAYHDHVCIDFVAQVAREIGGFRAPPAL